MHVHTHTHAINCLMCRSGRTLYANSGLRSLQSAGKKDRLIVKDKGEEETKIWGGEYLIVEGIDKPHRVENTFGGWRERDEW